MKNRKLSSWVALAAIGATLALASCGNNNPNPGPDSSESQQTTSSGDVPVVEDPNAAKGSFDYSGLEWQEKTKITAALEKYTLENFNGGIPLYDDSASEAFSHRFTPKSEEYITNYGFGTMEGTMDKSASAIMYNGPIAEPRAQYRNYFHGYTNTDSGTFNGWDATGSDVSDRMSMISSSYYGVEMTPDKKGYYWVGELARDAYPIMLTPKVGGGFDEHKFESEEDPLLDATSVYWRVYLHVGEGYAYNAVPGSKWENNPKYDGRKVAIEDYITPFKTMLDNRMTRYTELVTESSGFYKASDYVFNSDSSKTWESSGIGIQINRELCTEEYGVIDFHFISPHAAGTARTALASSLYSPVPAEFLTDIGGAKKYGVKGETELNTFDNFLCFGAYTPVYWESKKELIYAKNTSYFNADRYTLEGYTEKVYDSDKADDLAWADFKANKLDECTIPVSAIANKETYDKTYKTKGSTIIKINLNSATRAEWNYFFGPNGKVYKHPEGTDERGVGNWNGIKEIMSNHDFLMGFFFAVDRENLAKAAGRNPAVTYLSQAYMIDPTGKTPYRDSEEGKAVVAEWQEAAGNEFCYSPSLAEQYFHKAGEAMRAAGWEEGEEIHIQGFYRYESTIKNLGDYIRVGVCDIFNRACEDLGLTLSVDLKVGGTQYTDTYTLMDHGEFDFAEGAVSGNVLDPLNFMSTCSSSAGLHQGFNLNWGHPTDLMSDRPAVYGEDEDGDELHWSFDALWSASQGFTVVSEGCTKELGANQRFVGPGQEDPLNRYSGTVADNEILFLMDYPDEARTEEGDLLYTFSINECALFPMSSHASTTGGYYFNDYRLVENDSGWIELHLDKATIVEDCANIATSIKAPVDSITLQFYLVYTLYPGTEKANTKTMVVVPSVTLAELGMEPIRPR